MSQRPRRPIAALLMAVLLAAACGSTAPTVSAPGATTPAVTGSATTAPPTSTPTPSAPATTPATPTPSPTTTATAGPTAIPSETPVATGEAEEVPLPARPAQGVVLAGPGPILDANRNCQMGVPAGWQTGVVPATATTGATTEALASVTSTAIGDWATYKQTVRSLLLAGHAVAIDDERLLLIHSPDTSTDVTWVLVSNEGSFACSILATVKHSWIGAHTDDALAILESLQPAD